MTRPTTSLTVGYLVVVLTPTVPLLLTWYGVLTRRDSIPPRSVLTVKLPLAMVTVSCLLFLSWAASHYATHVAYSEQSSLLIYANSGVMMVAMAMALALLGKDPFRAALAATAAATALVWFYLWMMSAVV